MPLARHMAALALTAAGVATAFAQDPPNAEAAKGQGKANPNANAASKKKAARRKPRGNGAVGVVVPYPFPPVLIIRQTPEVHDEIRAFLDRLLFN